MKTIFFILFTTFVLFLFSSCSQPEKQKQGAILNITSFPNGAQIKDIKTGYILGVTPLYKGVFSDQGKKCDNIEGLQATWVSGATTINKNISYCKGMRYNISFTRPPDTPNLDADIKYSEIVERNRIEQRKANAEHRKANALQESVNIQKNNNSFINNYIGY